MSSAPCATQDSVPLNLLASDGDDDDDDDDVTFLSSIDFDDSGEDDDNGDDVDASFTYGGEKIRKVLVCRRTCPRPTTTTTYLLLDKRRPQL